MSVEDKKACIQVVIPTKYEAKAKEAGLIYNESDTKWTIPTNSKINYTYLQVPYNEKDLVNKKVVYGTKKESNGTPSNL